MIRGLFVCAMCIAPLGLAATGAAQDDPTCREEASRLDKYAYLRALSLDLRGVVPTVEEYEALDALDDVPLEWIEEWTLGSEYASRVARRHRALLWTSLANVRLIEQSWTLSGFNVGTGGDRYTVYFRSNVAEAYRGVRNARCLAEPATFDAEGELVCVPETTEDGREVCREGWVEVSPYWAPEETVRVCGYDAQASLLSATGASCSARDRNRDTSCGCGPNLMWCVTSSYERALRTYFGEEFNQRVMAHVENGEPYHQLLSGRRSFMNGPLTHFFRHQSQLFDNIPLTPGVVDEARLPDLEANQVDVWEEVALPEHHAGVLTSPVFLARFQTNRARANRFYDAFLCQPFQPPPGGLPFDDAEAAQEPDLQLRTGCNYCHALLEPAAAHWGRWTQQGGGFLAPDDYPSMSEDCRACAMGDFSCSDDCRRHYLTNLRAPEQRPYLGMLRAYEFLREEHYENVTQGPARLVRNTVVDNRFPSCAVTRTAEWLFGRDLRPDEGEWVGEVSDAYFGGDFRYRDLSLAVITSDTYRRVR